MYVIRDLKENRPVIRDWDPPFTTLLFLLEIVVPLHRKNNQSGYEPPNSEYE